MGQKTELLKKFKDEVVALKESPLYADRIKNNVFPVIGEGRHDAKIIFIGEAPGRNEAATGKPFCGAAGQVLTELIESIGLKREDVYITNIVKDRPPNNRDPLPEEIRIYAPFLDRQIEIIQPKVVATLGRYSMAYIMSRFLGNRGSSMAMPSGQNNSDSPFNTDGSLKTISQIHGKVFDAKVSYGNVKVVPLYHPAVALYQNSLKQQMFEDFKAINNFLT